MSVFLHYHLLSYKMTVLYLQASGVPHTSEKHQIWLGLLHRVADKPSIDQMQAEIHQCNMLKIISTKQSYSCGSSGVGLFVIGPYQLRCGSLVCIWSLNGLFYFTGGLHKSECLHP